MSDNAVVRALNWACQNSSVKYQIVRRDADLHICLNYPTATSLDRKRVAARVRTAIARLKLPNTKGIWLYTRTQGATQPEWKTYIDFAASFDPPTLISRQPSPQPAAPSSTTDVPPPKPKVSPNPTPVADPAQDVDRFMPKPSDPVIPKASYTAIPKRKSSPKPAWQRAILPIGILAILAVLVLIVLAAVF